MNLTEQIIAAHSGRSKVSPGENVWVDVDTLMTHDVFGPDVIRTFRKEFGEEAKIWDKNKFVIIPDHYIFTKDPYANKNIEFLDQAAAYYNLPHYYSPNSDRYSGVCHITLAQEGFNVPGSILIGTDSHTCTSGAFGMFATGVGLTDGAFILGSGKIWLKVPETIKVVFRGEMPKYLMAKDLILNLIGDIGLGGATYKSLEFSGETIENMSMEERMTLCNMAVEAGGKNGIIAADQTTIDYLAGKEKGETKIFRASKDAKYCLVKEYDVSKLTPVVAKPSNPSNRAYVKEVEGTKINKAYIGSCTGGKIEDFVAAAELLYGNKVKINTFIVPATKKVESQIKIITHKGKTLYDIFVEAGCRIGEPSCAACLGGPLDTFGRTVDREVVISSTNRNFPGRMGDKSSLVYLASPYTVAASAISGEITDPTNLLGK